MKKYIFVLACLFFPQFQGEVLAYEGNRVYARSMDITIRSQDVSYTPRDIESGKIISGAYTARKTPAIKLLPENAFMYAFDYKNTGNLVLVKNSDNYSLFRFKDYPAVGLVLEGGADKSYKNPVDARNNQEHYLGGILFYPLQSSTDEKSGSKDQGDHDLQFSAKIVLFEELTKNITIPKMTIGTVYVSFCDYKGRGRDELCNRPDEFGARKPLGDIRVGPFTLRAKPKTCSIMGNRDITVQLKEVSRRDFSGVGSEAFGGSVSIKLNCSDTIGMVYATLEDAIDQNNNTSILQIKEGAGKAKNVGIVLKNKNSGNQILSYNKHPTNIAPISDISNKWLVTSGKQRPTINLDAYYRSTGDISPGDVEAKTTIKFTYE